MNSDDEEDEKYFIEQRIKNGYTENTTHKRFKTVFPVVSPDGTFTASGMRLDICQINLMQKVLKYFPHDKYKIECLDWQEPYYRAVFGDRINIDPYSLSEFEE